MAKVRVHDAQDIKWFKIRDSFRADLLAGVDEPTLDSHVTVHEHGDDKLPHMSEADYQPFSDIAVHSHSADEVIYVVSGSMKDHSLSKEEYLARKAARKTKAQ